MSEPFCCAFEFKGNKHSIELSEEFCNEVFFKCIFVKIKQIIQLIDNKVVSFDSHVFEVLRNHFYCNLSEKNFEFKIRHKDLIRVKERYDNSQRRESVAANGIQSRPETRNGRNEERQRVVKEDKSRRKPPELTNDESMVYKSYTDVDLRSTPLASHPMPVFRQTPNRLNDLQKSFRSDSLVMSEAITYSQNNCDLIVDYEWKNVIHKVMTEKGFPSNDGNHWKKCYNYLIDEYIKTLNRFDSFESANNWFPIFDTFNTIYFNENNIKYMDIMRSRQKFLEKSGIDSKNVKTQPKPYQTLYHSVQHQMQASNRANQMVHSFRKYLENSFEDIKHFNILVQIIGKMNINYQCSDRNEVLAKASDCMKQNGIEWKANKCESILRQFIQYYSLNDTNYERILSKNRVIDYIHKHLNAFTLDENIIKNLLFIFKIDQKMIDSFKRLRLYKDYNYYKRVNTSSQPLIPSKKLCKSAKGP